MMTKETLRTGLIGGVIGLICSKVIIFFLAANGWGDIWLVNHRFLATFIFSLVFGLVAVSFSSF
jgi:hypothetical protein